MSPTPEHDLPKSFRSVAASARTLREQLNAAPEDRAAAVDDLAQAAARTDAAPEAVRSFGFEDAAGGTTAAPRAEADSLAALAAEVQVAQVLIAAGRAAGEAGEPEDPAVLDDAILRFETFTQQLEEEHAAAAGAPRHAGFDEAGEGAGRAAPGTPQALAAHAAETLDALVADAESVVNVVLKRLSKEHLKSVEDALGTLGDAFPALRGIGKLIAQGFAKLQRAVAALARMVGGDALKWVRGRAKELWQKLAKGEQTRGLLAWLFGVDAARGDVNAVLGAAALEAPVLAGAAGELDALRARFHQNAALLRLLVGGAAVAGTLLTPVLPQTPLVMAGVYATLVGVVILLGMDYCDAGGALHTVRGVREIVRALEPAA